jgi:tetratricopeptide (TPR) repeat protein
MKVELKTWTGLGLATVLIGASLAGCSGEAGESGAATADGAQVAGESGEGEGGESGEGEGGESGEGGVDIAAAGSDPVVYTTALAVVEAHVIAARDAYAAGKKNEAAEMFAHPVSEVLLAMDPVFAKLGVKDFKPLLTDTSEAALAGKSAAEIDKSYDAIIAALRDAAKKAPDDGTAAALVAAGVSSDMLERAATMYREAIKHGTYEQYLDGYGYYKASEATFRNSAVAIKRADPALHGKFEKALALFAKAYPGAPLPAKLDTSEAALSAAASTVQLALPAS